MKVILTVADATDSEEVLRSVAKKEWPIDTQFKVLTVLEPLDCIDEKYEDLAHGVNVKRTKAAEHLCQSMREQLEATIPGALVHYEIRSGRPQDEIIDVAAQWSADRIIIGAHGKRGCGPKLLGSVSSSVAGHAPCSVEIVRERTKSHSLR